MLAKNFIQLFLDSLVKKGINFLANPVLTSPATVFLSLGIPLHTTTTINIVGTLLPQLPSVSLKTLLTWYYVKLILHGLHFSRLEIWEEIFLCGNWTMNPSSMNKEHLNRISRLTLSILYHTQLPRCQTVMSLWQRTFLTLCRRRSTVLSYRTPCAPHSVTIRITPFGVKNKVHFILTTEDFVALGKVCWRNAKLNVNGLIGNYFGSALGKHLCFLQGLTRGVFVLILFALFSCEATSRRIDIHLNQPSFSPVVLYYLGEGNHPRH